MLKIQSLSFAILCTSFLISSAAHAIDPEFEELMYRAYYSGFTEAGVELAGGEALSPLELRYALDAAEDALLEDRLRVDLGAWLPESELSGISAREQVRWFRLRAIQRGGMLGATEEASLAARFGAFVAGAPNEIELFYELLRSAPYWRSAAGAELVRQTEAMDPASADFYRRTVMGNPGAVDAGVVSDLFSQLPNLSAFQGGSYARTPRLFMFCRSDRRYPCLFAMRDRNDQPVRRVDGSLWTQPALALSVLGLPFSERNGYTPQGIHRVDGVMPSADRPEFFGRFRRLVLDFVDRTDDEVEQKRALPSSSANATWWHEAVVARDIGRSLFRIHGTGQINENPASSYYPFYPTHGCISQRENRYGGVDYTDQRALLDRWMEAAGLTPIFGNETRIRGLLYVIEIDDTRAPVAARDLERFGIR